MQMSKDDPRHGGTEFSGKAGMFEGKIRGFRIADLVMAIIIIWALAVKPYLDSERENKRDIAIAKEHAAIAEAQKEFTSAFNEFSYIILLPADQRQGLNMGMPQSLRDKLFDRPTRRGSEGR